MKWTSRAGRLHAILTDLWHLPLRSRKPDAYHQMFADFVQRTEAMNAPSILELGSRNVSGNLRRQMFPKTHRFTGFDIQPGEGVDLVGDAHRLSRHVAPSSIDVVFSFSVFEHLVYPWKVVLEINKVLKPGGLLFVSTHPVWPPHELPWDFWRFPVAGLRHLFVKDTGFEVIAAAEGLPARMYSLVSDPPTRNVRLARVNQGVSVLARKTHDYDHERLRWDIDIDEVLKSEYPRP